jgi:hypothetical protein
MSNNMEIYMMPDGQVRLCFWDSLYGEDRVFTIETDGTVFEETIEEDDETRKIVNLVEELRKIALALY